jgi:RNA polymerase sigma-70 factor (ECF subfamily)
MEGLPYRCARTQTNTLLNLGTLPLTTPEPNSLDPVFAEEDGGEGDRAFAERFTEHRQRLKQMLHFRMDPRLRSRTDLSDILQEAYIDAYRRLDHYASKPNMSFYVWLRQVTMQRLIDIHRQHLLADKRDVRNEVRLGASDYNAATSAAIAKQFVDQMVTPSQVAIRQEMAVQLETTLENLDEIDRDVLALRHFEELGNSEVAEVLGISEAAASNRYVRALARLRKDLQKIPDFFDVE